MSTHAHSARKSAAATDIWERDRLEALDALDILDTPSEPEFDRVARLIKNIFGVKIALVTMIDAHRQWYKACIGLQASEVSRRDTFCTQTIRSNDPVIVPNALNDPRFSGNRHVLGEPHVRFYAGVPLRTSDGQAIGTVCAIDYEPRPFGEREIGILTDLAEVVISELELRKLAAVDMLTGVMSRRSFREEGANAIALSMRHQSHLSCIAIDIDHFKTVNDTYGHAAGDKALAAVAGAIRDTLRQSDHIGRLGGEEFAVLLPHTGRAKALEVGEKLRAVVEALTIDIGTQKIGVTASFGIAQFDIAAKNIDILLAHADSALYEAKKAGRNRCVGWRRSAAAEMMLRRRVLKAGLIVFNGRQSTMDCTVRSISDGGAGLDVSDALALPQQFGLLIRADGFETECRIVSRTDRHMEVEFC